MKKILTVALVALLAAGTAFAGFSGNANIKLGYDFENGNYGFKNGTGFDVNLDLVTAAGEQKGEGDVYAGIKASVALTLANKKGDKGTEVVSKDGDQLGIGAFFKLAEAYVAGQDWKVAITSSTKAVDLAKSAIDTKKDDVKDAFGNKYDTKDVAATYVVDSFKAPGVTATVAGYSLGLGFRGNKTAEKLAVSAAIATPEIALTEGFTVKGGASYVYTKGLSSDDDKKEFGTKDSLNTLGGSVAVKYAGDSFVVSAATDLGYDFVSSKFNADVAANLQVSPVVVDVYYATATKLGEDTNATANVLSAQAKVDLKDFDVPVALTVTGKNLINKQDLSAKAQFSIDKVDVTVKGGYVIKDTTFSVGGEVAYKADAFTAKAGADYSMKTDGTDKKLTATASVESSALIPGATLKLGYGKSDDNKGKNFNLLDGKYGKVEASVKVAF